MHHTEIVGIIRQAINKTPLVADTLADGFLLDSVSRFSSPDDEVDVDTLALHFRLMAERLTKIVDLLQVLGHTEY